MYIVSAPLRVLVTKKKYFVLNINQYRNAHYFTLNNAKVGYSKLIEEQVKSLPQFNKVKLTFTYFPKDKRLNDLSNVLSIHDKFFCDTLVRHKKLPDDTYLQVCQVDYRFGEIDKQNPRVDILIEPED